MKVIFKKHYHKQQQLAPENHDAWKTLSFAFGIVNFQGRALKLPGSKMGDMICVKI